MSWRKRRLKREATTNQKTNITCQQSANFSWKRLHSNSFQEIKAKNGGLGKTLSVYYYKEVIASSSVCKMK